WRRSKASTPPSTVSPANASEIVACEMPAAWASADICDRNELKSPPQRAANAGGTGTDAAKTNAKRNLRIKPPLAPTLRMIRRFSFKCQTCAGTKRDVVVTARSRGRDHRCLRRIPAFCGRAVWNIQRSNRLCLPTSVQRNLDHDMETCHSGTRLRGHAC